MKTTNPHFYTILLLLIFFTSIQCLNLYAEKIVFSADSMSGTAGDKSDTTTLSGNAFVKTDSMEITADSIELKGDNFRFIYATGKITGKNTEAEMSFTCDYMKYDRETKIAQLKDTVHLIDEKNNVTADAQLIEYNQNTEIAIMQIDVTLKQKDNVCTSAYAIYRKDAQMLEMSGNPKIIQGTDMFRAQEITLNLDSQQITLDGRVSGSVTDNNKTDDTNGKSPDGKTKPDAPPPAAGETNKNLPAPASSESNTDNSAESVSQTDETESAETTNETTETNSADTSTGTDSTTTDDNN